MDIGPAETTAKRPSKHRYTCERGHEFVVEGDWVTFQVTTFEPHSVRNFNYCATCFGEMMERLFPLKEEELP